MKTYGDITVRNEVLYDYIEELCILLGADIGKIEIDTDSEISVENQLIYNLLIEIILMADLPCDINNFLIDNIYINGIYSNIDVRPRDIEDFDLTAGEHLRAIELLAV